MMTSIRVAILAVATLAAMPAMAQSQNEGGGEASNTVGGGPGGGSNARPDRPEFECLQRCEPKGEKPSSRVILQRERCGQQLTYGRDAIYYYERCDRFM